MKEIEMPTRTLQYFLLILAASLVTACSNEQAYNSLKGWQQNECNKRVDNVNRLQCLKDADTSYDEYRKQTGQ